MKQTAIRVFLACFISTLALGCTSGPFHGGSGGDASAKIYVLRHFSVGKGGAIQILANGTSIGTIHRGGVLQWSSKPGKVVVSASGANAATLTVDVQPNQTYYVEVRAVHGEDQARSAQLRLLSDREGAKLLETLQKKDNPFRGLQ